MAVFKKQKKKRLQSYLEIIDLLLLISKSPRNYEQECIFNITAKYDKRN